MINRSSAWRVGVFVTGLVAVIALAAAPASAHVTVNPREATPGGFAKLAFRVPNEKDNASTTKVEIFLPVETPIASVSTRPVPGWSVTVEKTTLPTPVEVHGRNVTEAVSKITWTAQGEANYIGPGQFQEFEISGGPLPEADKIVFKALQTYSDGDVVRWIEEPTEGAEPERPAPVLTLVKAEQSGNQSGNAAQAPTAAEGDQGGSSWTGGTSLALAILALVCAIVALALTLDQRKEGGREERA